MKNNARREGPKPWDKPIVQGAKGININLNAPPAKARTLKEQFGAFETLVQENFKALESMASIRPAVEKGEALPHCIDLITAVQKMAWCYGRMTGKDYAYIFNKVKSVGTEALNLVSESDLAARMRYMGHVDEMKEEISEYIDGLNIEQCKSQEFTDDLARCSTLHDIVRLLHQKSEPGILKEMRAAYKFSMFRSKFKIGDIGGAVKAKQPTMASRPRILARKNIASKPLLAMLEFYDSYAAQEKIGYEDYTLLCTANRMRAQCNMGCHNAELDAQIKEKESFIHFRFFNTDVEKYKYANCRADYVRRVLGRLGFQVYGSGKLTEASLISGQRETYAAMAKLAALIASTRDLDTYSGIKGRVDEAVDAFFEGRVNIQNALKANAKAKLQAPKPESKPKPKKRHSPQDYSKGRGFYDSYL